jgi:hypothetical protein
MDTQDRPSSKDPVPASGRALVAVEASREARGASPVEAHLLSQDERRRGLRSGAQAVEAATSAYSETEWYGGANRRRPAGGAARKDV